MLRRLLVGAVFLVAAAATPAGAQNSPPPGDGVDANATNSPGAPLVVSVDSITTVPGTPGADGRDGDGGGGGGGGAPNCTTSDGQPAYINYGPLMFTTQEEQRTDIRPWEQRPGRWAWKRCGNDNLDLVFLPDAPDAAPVDPLVLAQSAREQLSPPSPRARTNPTSERSQLVNLRTWLWIDPGAWQPVSATASAGAVSATVTAAPSSVRWEMGDGAVVECRGPGTPYDPSRPESAQSTDCSHTYRRSSAGEPDQRYTVRVTMVYGVSWTASGAPGGGDLGIVETTDTLPLRVAEGQAVVVAR